MLLSKLPKPPEVVSNIVLVVVAQEAPPKYQGLPSLHDADCVCIELRYATILRSADVSGVVTVTLLVIAFDPPAFVAVRVMVNEPALAKVIVGLVAVVEENETPVDGEADHA